MHLFEVKLRFCNGCGTLKLRDLWLGNGSVTSNLILAGIFELGPRSLRTAGFIGGNSIKLADELGLADDMIHVSIS